MQIDMDKLAALHVRLDHESALAPDGGETVRHSDRWYARRVNLWRDILPLGLKDDIMGLAPGQEVVRELGPGEIVEPWKEVRNLRLGLRRFRPRTRETAHVRPRFGRFYPRGLLDHPAFFPSDTHPFRVTELDEAEFTADANPPFARSAGRLAIEVMDVADKISDTGGRCNEPVACAAEFAGMQARHDGRRTDFYVGEPFSRSDESADAVFYTAPRMVAHVDDQALALVRGIYAELLEPGGKVLDLMSSLHSHMPEEDGPGELVGLGLNRDELDANEALSERVVQDLNAEPKLPFGEDAFDACVCSMSVEYLTRPFEIFSEVARVLRPGGLFVCTFSHRWFPPKVVQLWTELHEFERPGLVLDYFGESGAFTDLNSRSERGWPRPFVPGDRYWPMMRECDPVHAVWGTAV
jgi:SAM-dependent methyltransferase